MSTMSKGGFIFKSSTNLLKKVESNVEVYEEENEIENILKLFLISQTRLHSKFEEFLKKIDAYKLSCYFCWVDCFDFCDKNKVNNFHFLNFVQFLKYSKDDYYKNRLNMRDLDASFIINKYIGKIFLLKLPTKKLIL